MDFDHALILQGDLAAAERATRRLGFRPTPTGHHGQGLGTANLTVMMPDRRTYFEQIAVVEPTDRNAGKRAALAALGPHLYGAAFKGDAAAEAARFATLGVDGGPAFDFARPVEMPEGPAEARFRVAQMAEGALPGLYAFVCEHFTPAVVWREDHLAHANSARSVAGLWGVAPDPAALAERWRALVDPDAALGSEGLAATAGATAIRYLAPEAWASRFGPVRTETPRLLALEIRVASLDDARRALAEGDVPSETVAEGLRVPDTAGFGATVLFTEEAR